MDLLLYLLHLAAILVSLTMAGLVLFRNPRPLMNKVFVFLCSSVAFWAFSEFETMHANDAEGAAEFIKMQLIWPLVPAFLLHFTLLLTKHNNVLSHRLSYYLLYGPPFAIVLGYLFLPGFGGEPVLEHWGWTSTLPSAPYFLTDVLYGALLALLSFFLCLQYFRRQSDRLERARARLTMIGIGIPVIAGTVSQVFLPLAGFMVPELTTIGFTIGIGGFIGYAILKYNLFELTPAAAAGKILETMSDSLIIVDPGGRITTTNEAAIRLLGYRRNELIGSEFGILFASENDRAECEALLEDESFTGASAIELDFRISSGKVVPISLSCSVLRDEAGRRLGTVCAARDISERKRREEAVRESEERYRTLVDTSPDGILVLDLDGTIRMCNPPIYQAHGFQTADQILGKNGIDFVVPEARQKASEHLQAVAQGEPVIAEYDLLTAAGAAWPAAINGAAIRDADGNPTGIVLIVRDISELIKAEKALRESETRYRTLFETSPDGIAFHDSDGKIIMANSQAAQITGYEDPADLIGRRPADFIQADDLERLAADMREADSSVVRNREYRVIRPDGTNCYVDISASTLANGHGEPAGVFTILRDITERKSAEMALSEKEAMLTEAQRVASLGSWEMNFATGEMQWSSELFRIFGMAPQEEVSQESLFQHVHPDDRTAVIKAFDQILDRGEIPPMDHRIVRGDGVERYVRDEGSVTIGGGKPSRAVGTIQDITERKQAEKALQESEARYRELINTSPDDIALVDLNGNFVMANQRAAESHGYDSVDELKQINYLDLIVPEERESAQETFAEIIRAGGLKDVVFTLLRKDGSRFLTETNSSLIRDAGGLPLAVLGITRDISERKLVEDEMQRMADDISLVNLLNDASNRGDPVPDILNLMAQEVRTMFGCGGAGVYLVSDDGRYLRLDNFLMPPAKFNLIERLVGPALKSREIKARLTAGSVYEHILHENQVELIDHPESIRQMMSELAQTASLKKLIPNVLRVSGIKSVIAVPLVTGGEPLGLLDFSRERPFSEDDVGRIKSIAEHLGIILERKQSEEALTRSEARYRTLVETSPDAIIVADPDGRITLCNQRTAELHGYQSPADLTGHFINREFVAPEDSEAAGSLWKETVKAGTQVSGELTLIRKDGSRFPAEVAGTAIIDEAGRPTSIIGIMRDITERKRYEQQIINQSRELAERNRELDTLYGVSAAVGHTIDMDELLQRILDKIIDFDLFKIMRDAGIFLVEDDRLRLASHLEHSPEFVEMHRDLRKGECLCGLAARTGEVIVSSDCFEDERHTIHYPGMQNHGHVIVPLTGVDEVVGVLYMYTLPETYVDERKQSLLATIGNQIGIAIQNARLYEKTKELSLHDPLTGLANRNLMNLELDDGFTRSKRNGMPIAVIMLDLDWFKNYNDNYGHAAGDRALQEIAGLLKHEVRETDLPVRFGGEEFLIVLSETAGEAALLTAERIRAAVERYDFFPREGEPPARMTVSLGVAAFSAGAGDADSLISAADTALYQAKTKGRNRVECRKNQQ